MKATLVAMALLLLASCSEPVVTSGEAHESPEAKQVNPRMDSPFLIWGRFLDSEGNATRGSAYALRKGEHSGFVGEVDREGYTIHLREPGDYRVEGVSREGSTAVDSVLLTHEQPHVELDLTVENGRSITGALFDRNGEVAAGVPLLFLHLDHRETFDPKSRVMSTSNWPHPKRVEPGGILRQSVRTGAMGKFDVRCLAHGPYLIYAGTGNRFGPEVQPLNAYGVQAGSQDVRLEVHRPHLVVRLFDERGKAFSLQPEFLGGFRRPGEIPWPSKPLPFCTGPDGKRLRGQRLGDEMVYELEAGKRYVVGARGGAVREPTTSIVISETAGRILHEFHCDPQSVGKLQVTVSRSDSAELHESFRVSLEEVGTGVVLFRDDHRRGSPETIEMKLPIGTYGLVVEGIDWRNHITTKLITSAKSGRARKPIHIAADTLLQLQAILPGLEESLFKEAR